MKISRLFAGVALAMLCAPMFAQPSLTGYHSVACFKVKPENAAAFHKFVTEESHKLAQGRIDDGEITTWYLLRSVLPQGTAAECDYRIVAIFAGAPHLLGTEELTNAIKKAGMSISADEYVNHRNAVSTLVSVAMYRNVLFVGPTAKKGDYFHVNYMKGPDAGEWIAYEKKVWQPIAEDAVKDGSLDGWSLNVRVLPAGPETSFEAVTVDVVSSFAAGVTLRQDPKLGERFKRVHPDLEFGTTFEQFGKLRTTEAIELYQLEDVVSK